jgi:hypothetical protein
MDQFQDWPTSNATMTLQIMLAHGVLFIIGSTYKISANLLV